MRNTTYGILRTYAYVLVEKISGARFHGTNQTGGVKGGVERTCPKLGLFTHLPEWPHFGRENGEIGVLRRTTSLSLLLKYSLAEIITLARVRFNYSLLFPFFLAQTPVADG